MGRRGRLPYVDAKREYESPIHEFRVAAGLTCKELAKQSGVAMGAIYALANGMMAPIKENIRGELSGELRKSAKLLCKFFEVGPEVLFPRYICSLDRSFKYEVQPYETWSERVANGSIDRNEDYRMAKRTVLIGLNVLTQRERRILISAFYYDESYAEIARREGVGRATISHIAIKALSRCERALRKNGIKNIGEAYGR